MTTTALTDNQRTTTLFATLQPWIICFSAALFFFYEFIQLNMFNAISAQLMRDFSINGVQLGNLSATYLYADVLFLFPAGIILDRVSVRKVILIALTLCIAGTFLFSIATAFWFAAACHFLAGIGNAFSFLSCIMLASRWFPPRRMALVTGLIVTFAMVGGLVAQTPLTILAGEYGWRHALMFNSILGFIILAINWLYIQNKPNHTAETSETPKTEVEFLASIKLALKNVHTWLYGIYTSLLNLPIMILGALWGSLNLIQTHHLSPKQASYVTSMIFLGTIFGSPILGWISDRIGLRRVPMIVCAILSVAVMVSIIYLPNLTLIELIALYFLLGFFTSSQVISYPAITESNPKYITGTAMGIASVLIMGGGAISQPLFGWLLDLKWDKLMVMGTPIYSSAAYTYALNLIPIAFVVGLAAVLLAKETYCRTYKDK